MVVVVHVRMSVRERVVNVLVRVLLGGVHAWNMRVVVMQIIVPVPVGVA